jgi:hypothetical protein
MNITHDESPGKGMSSPQQQPFHSPHEPQITSPKPTPPYSTSNSNSAIPVLSSGTKHTSSYSNGHANINHPNNPKPITIEELRKFFHLPIAEVAKHFGTCTTALKKLCRKLHIHKWPYRQILSLSKSIQSLEYAAKCDGVSNETRAQFRSQISILEQMIAEVVQDPSKAMEALNKELEASVANGDGGAEKNEDIQNLIIAATAALSKSVNNNNPANKNATNNNNISTINSSSDDNHHYTQSVQKAVVSSSSGMPLPSSHYQPSTQLHQSFQLSQNPSQQQQQQLHHSQPPPQQQLSQNWSASSTGKKQQSQHQPQQQQQQQHQQYKSGLKRSNDSFDDIDHHLPYTNNILTLNSNNNNNINNSNNNNSHNQQLDERIHKKGKVHGDQQAGNGHGQGSPRFNGYDDRALTLSPSDLMKLKEVDVGLTTVQSIYNHAGNKYHFTGQVLLAPLHRKKFRPNTNRKIIPLMEPDIGNSFSVDFFPNIIMGPK